MKNAIGAVITLFVVYLHLLVVPPRNLRGYYYKNFEASNQNRTCNYEWVCNDVLGTADREMYCGVEPISTEKTHTCFGACLTYTTEMETDDGSRMMLFSGKRCIEYCEPYCLTIEEGITSCFSCCFGNQCN